MSANTNTKNTTKTNISNEEVNTQVLNDIQNLQKIERDLFKNLEENRNLNNEEKEKIVKKINDISKMRIHLYNTLTGVNSYFHNVLQNSRYVLSDQAVAIGIVENELNEAKTRLKQMEEEKYNKIRLIQINNYYGEKYAEHTQFMKIVAALLFALVVLLFLYNRGLLPQRIFYMLLVVIIVIGTYYAWKRFFSIVTRHNMNYETYEWPFVPKEPKNQKVVAKADPWFTGDLPGTCVGQGCCSNGLTYDSKINQCVTVLTPTTTQSTTTTPTTKESFVNSISNYISSLKNIKPDVTLNEDKIVPKPSTSFIYK